MPRNYSISDREVVIDVLVELCKTMLEKGIDKEAAHQSHSTTRYWGEKEAARKLTSRADQCGARKTVTATRACHVSSLQSQQNSLPVRSLVTYNDRASMSVGKGEKINRTVRKDEFGAESQQIHNLVIM